MPREDARSSVPIGRQNCLEEIDVPKIQDPSDIIVEIEVCSICGTDVKITDVPLLKASGATPLIVSEPTTRSIRMGKIRRNSAEMLRERVWMLYRIFLKTLVATWTELP